MDNNFRQSLLKAPDGLYLALEKTALSSRDLKKKVAKVVLGEKPKKLQFTLGGRLRIQGEVTSGEMEKSGLKETFPIYVVEGEGESVGVALKIENEEMITYEGAKYQDVLKEGDLVLVQSNWEQVRLTGGMSPDLSYIVADQIQVLAPNLAPVRVESWEYKRGRQWDFFLQTIRKCFQFLEFTEVRTPLLVVNPGMESHLVPFVTEFQFGSGRKIQYLPTSPELHLKKLLSEGWTRVFEFKECFRNNELGEHHQPNFLMLEWYRGFSNLEHIAKDLQGLLNYLKLKWPDQIRGFSPLQRTTVRELFKKHLNFDLQPNTTVDELKNLSIEYGIEYLKEDDFDDIFHRLWMEKLELELKRMGPVLVFDYPPSQAALARIGETGWASRFEFYWKGLEIANAFDELNDPKEQMKRFEEERSKRVSLGNMDLEIDQEFIKALSAGMPPSGGIALGVERLFMALVDLNEIGKSTAFPFKFNS